MLVRRLSQGHSKTDVVVPIYCAVKFPNRTLEKAGKKRHL